MEIKALQIFKPVLFTFLFTLWISDHSFASGWYDANWKYRKTITINYQQVPSAQVDFTILVSLTSDADLNAKARADGYDILFTSGDGVTKIPYQRQSYSSGTLMAWVKVPSLSNTANTVIYMYYGNSGSTDQQEATSAWDLYYIGVYHLDENSTGTGDYKDNHNLTIPGYGTANNGTIMENNVLRAAFTMYDAGINDFRYDDLSDVADYVIVSGDVLVYDVYWTSSTDFIALDFTTGTNTLRDTPGNLDQNGITAHPSADLSAYALNKWYRRVIPIPAALYGQTIQYYDIACETENTGAITAYIDNIYIVNSAGGVTKTIHEHNGSVNHTVHITSNASNALALSNVPNPFTTRSVAGKMVNCINDDGHRYLKMSTYATAGGSDWTFEAWIKLNAFSQLGWIFHNGDATQAFGLAVQGNQLWGYYPGTASPWISTGYSLTPGIWTHVAMKRNATSNITNFFVNGAKLAATSTLLPTNATQPLTFGALLSGGLAYWHFSGLIDEVRITYNDRSDSWIQTAYNNQSSPSTFYTVESEICHVTATVTATQNVSCYGMHDGAITVSAGGGTSPYYFSTDNGTSWYPSSGGGITGPYEFTGLNATTTYRARVKDSNGCMSPLMP